MTTTCEMHPQAINSDQLRTLTEIAVTLAGCGAAGAGELLDRLVKETTCTLDQHRG
jgi:hypothetical protein